MGRTLMLEPILRSDQLLRWSPFVDLFQLRCLSLDIRRLFLFCNDLWKTGHAARKFVGRVIHLCRVIFRAASFRVSCHLFAVESRITSL